MGIVAGDQITASHVVSSCRNFGDVINGNFRVASYGTTFTSATVPANSDDTYLFPGWCLLSDGNDIVDVHQSTGGVRLQVETANKQFGWLHILEAKDSEKYIGGVASLSFKASMAAADDNTHSVKAVILSWSSTADTVTSDVVGTWAASITSWAANWTAENVAASNTLTTTPTTIKIENVAIDTASTTNIAIFFYCDQTDGAVDDEIIITDVKLEQSAVATVFLARPYAEEEFLCRRRHQKSFARGTAPAQNAGVNGATRLVVTVAGAATNFSTSIPLCPPMRTTPATLTTYNPSAANAQVRNLNTSADATNTAISATSESCIYINWTGDAGGAVGARCIVHWSAEAEL